MNEELYQQIHAQQMAAMTRVLGKISHDFNNILAAILGYSEFLCEDLPDGTQEHRFAQNILQSGQQAQNMIEYIHSLSRKNSNTKIPLDMRLMLKQCLETYGREQQSVLFIVSLDETIVADIQGDYAQITKMFDVILYYALQTVLPAYDIQVRFSRCSNTIRGAHTSNKQPVITIENIASAGARISFSALQEAEDYLCFSVSYKGAPIAAADMHHIFEPFYFETYYAKNAQSPKADLSVLYSILQFHQGMLTLSAYDDGHTQFEVTLPLSGAQEISPSLLQDQIDTIESDVRGGHILVVDDQAHVCDMVAHMISRLGYQVSCFSSALDAIDYIRESIGNIDLVISDQVMPDITGIEFVSEISLDFPHLPVVLMSGYHTLDIIEEIKKRPTIKAFLKKPLDMNTLSAVIANNIADRKQEKTLKEKKSSNTQLL